MEFHKIETVMLYRGPEQQKQASWWNIKSSNPNKRLGDSNERSNFREVFEVSVYGFSCAGRPRSLLGWGIEGAGGATHMVLEGVPSPPALPFLRDTSISVLHTKECGKSFQEESAVHSWDAHLHPGKRSKACSLCVCDKADALVKFSMKEAAEKPSRNRTSSTAYGTSCGQMVAEARRHHLPGHHGATCSDAASSESLRLLSSSYGHERCCTTTL
ncbi:hypothetical protein GWK47_001539 [Chionoecetes opilio]|uniref:Uncharacterized protein n=1 Tax=Chionoecetes opilio TaxID=41210 RepID=A0A8J4XZP7_CHIOP|nr:hypothetical protein GWK47_001539 [Chionoecetes opilio]